MVEPPATPFERVIYLRQPCASFFKYPGLPEGYFCLSKKAGTALPFKLESTQETITAHRRVRYRDIPHDYRIKELKPGFGMERMPCGQFSANAVFFRLGVLAYNLCQGLMKRFPALHPNRSCRERHPRE
jgi:hypothetical protein